MRKLQLDPESLHVETFVSSPTPTEKGTVAAYNGMATAVYTCWPTCGTTVRYTVCNGYDCL